MAGGDGGKEQGNVRVEDAPPRERVEAYIENVAHALDRLDHGEAQPPGEPRARSLVELARAYLSDARYYLEHGDTFTALAAIAYAEGLIDALRHLGHIKGLEWLPTSSLLARPKVLVAGTFDIIHPGHIELLRQAWRRGRVHVIVARDKTVERLKGRPPVVPEQQRLETVAAIRYVHAARLGSTRDMLEPILEIRPDIILLGPDQWADENWLAEQLSKHGLHPRIERLPEKKQCPLCSSSQIIERAARLLAANNSCNKHHRGRASRQTAGGEAKN